MVCFSPQDVSGRIEHVACPAINMSRGGFLLEYDQSIPVGTGCSISYRTISQQPVRVSGRIRHCKDIGGGRYHIGIELHRHLGREELRPAKAIPGREVAPGIRTRSLAPAVLDVGDDPEAAQPSPLTD